MDTPHRTSLLVRLNSTYWFLPSIVTVVAACAGELLVWIDRVYPDGTAWLGWAYGGGAAGARALLSAIAGSTITVVSVTFSVLVVALTVSSQHFGPRLLNNFMRDRPAQLVLGMFTGTFAYCLMVLRTVQGDSGGLDAFFVPHLAVTGAVALTLSSLGLLIFYVHHVAIRMQVSEITAAVARDLEQTIERLYPDRLGKRDESAPIAPPELPETAMVIPAIASGYLQEIDARAILEAARRHQATLWLFRRPGDFVIEGTVVAGAHPPPPDERALADAVAGAFVVGADRTSNQDAAFAVQQLVEVSLRALSPGVNEAFTAITCIDRLGQGLSKILTRRIPSAIRTDQEGVTRVIARPYTFDELARAAFEPITLYAERNPAIYARLLETLASLGEIARRPDDRRAIASLADFVCEAGEKQAAYHWDRVELARGRVRQLVGG